MTGASWQALSAAPVPIGETVFVRERDGSETTIKVGSRQWEAAVRDLGPDMPVRRMAADVVAEREAAAGRTRPVNGHCPTCDHEWTVCYLPMPLDTAAALMMAAKCPKGCTAGPRVGSMV